MNISILTNITSTNLAQKNIARTPIRFQSASLRRNLTNVIGGVERERGLVTLKDGLWRYVEGVRNVWSGTGSSLDAQLEPHDCYLEWVTKPHLLLRDLALEIAEQQRTIRDALAPKGIHMIHSSTLMLDTGAFKRTDPEDPYHSWIQRTYGKLIATMSDHQTWGLENLSQEEKELLPMLINANRLEASLYLALSTSSPIKDGAHSGNKSERALLFPRVTGESTTPFFTSYEHLQTWFQNLRQFNRSMFAKHPDLQIPLEKEVRLWWDTCRGNGMNRGNSEFDWIELRISDAVPPQDTMAIAAFLRTRAKQFISDSSTVPMPQDDAEGKQWAQWCIANEKAVAREGLDAIIKDPFDGWNEKTARAAIQQRIEDDQFKQHITDDSTPWLEGVTRILSDGTEADFMIKLINQGKSVQDVIEAILERAEEFDRKFYKMVTGNNFYFEGSGLTSQN